MTPIELIRLDPILLRSKGRREITIGLVDGPVFLQHPALVGRPIREVSSRHDAGCSLRSSKACAHGTFLAGMIANLCGECTLLVRPIFPEPDSDSRPGTSQEELARAIVDAVDAGARILNLSTGLAHPSPEGERALGAALDYTVARDVLCVTAAGNQGSVGGSLLTWHPWIIPVAACNLRGAPTCTTNLGSSIGRQGVCAPDEDVAGPSAEGSSTTMHGTSVAAAFVTATVALLWSLFPSAPAVEIRAAVTRTSGQRRRSIVPPLLDAWAAYQTLGQSMN